MLEVNELIGFGMSESGHRHWRAVIVTAAGWPVGIGELEMRATVGGADQCSGGSCGASSTGSGSCVYVFDNAVSDALGWVPHGYGIGESVRYSFASNVDVNEIRIHSISSALYYWPTQVRIEWSDDLANWTEKATVATGLTGINQFSTVSLV